MKRMNQRLMAVILILILVLSMSLSAGASDNTALRAADAMNHLGLFLGRTEGEKDYDLEGTLNRSEGTIVLLRMMGEAEDAEDTDAEENPFEDLTNWTTPYVVYAWKTGLVNGRSDTVFDPAGAMSDHMFLTLVLRVLGYQDGNKAGEEGTDFYWKEPYQLAKETGLISITTADDDFTRGDMVSVFWNALDVEFKGEDKTLADELIADGVFTAAALAQARNIYAYGTATPPVPSVPGGGQPSYPGSGDSGTTDPDPDPSPNPDPDQTIEVTYEEYAAMDGAQRQAFMEEYFGLDAEGMEAFFQWYNQAKEEYEAGRTEIDIGDGNVDLGDILSGTNQN